FALGGDSGGDFRPIAFETGSYTLTLTPYAEKGAKGTIGEVTEISFTVINQAFDPCEEGTPEIAVGNDWVLTCDQETIQLSATSSENGDFQWRGPNAFNKVGESVQVPAAGTYTLTFTNSSGCSVTDQLKVVKEEYSPILDLPTSVSLGCEENTTVIPLKVGSFAELEWIGPNGYSSGEIQPVVTEAGVYSLVVTNDKGCTATATSSVRFQAYDPAINVPSSYSLDCESENTPLNIQLDSYASLSWTGPDGFFSEEENIQVQEEGVYTLRVYSSGGCEAIYEVQLTPCVEACTESAIDRIILVDAGSDKDMLEIQEGSTLVVGSQNGGFAIRAEEIACSFPVKSVRFSLSGKQNRTRTESKAPWAAFGDRNGDFSAWNAEPGSYTLQAIPYSEKGGKGQAGKAKEVSFTVIAAQTGIAQMSSQAGSSSSSFLDEPHMRIMPNPVADQAKLEVVGRRNGRINVAIFNLLGEVVLEADFDKSMDSQSFSLALSGLANGIYTAQVIYDRQLFSQKILVKK
ncbi:MAG: T9SS type A sorting domain-containing protein, partial [Bacteroidota bacterium]